MTTEVWQTQPIYTVAGTGPYAVENPYGVGDLVVAAISAAGVRTVLDPADYSVTPTSSATTGDVYLTSGAAATHAGSDLYIARLTGAQQGWLGASAREKGLEAQLDQMTRVDQEMQASWGNAIRADRPLIPAVPQPGYFLAWNLAGNGIENVPDTEGVQAIADAAAASAAAAEAAADVLIDPAVSGKLHVSNVANFGTGVPDVDGLTSFSTDAAGATPQTNDSFNDEQIGWQFSGQGKYAQIVAAFATPAGAFRRLVFRASRDPDFAGVGWEDILLKSQAQGQFAFSQSNAFTKVYTNGGLVTCDFYDFNVIGGFINQKMLGKKAKHWTIELVCATAEGGFAVNDRVPLAAGVDAVNVGFTMKSVTDHLYLRVGSAGIARLVNGGAAFVPTPANWQLSINVYA